MRPDLKEILEISRFYGGDPDWVIAGGGNSSVKNDEILLIKASGFALADVTPESLVAIDRKVFKKVWTKEYPRETDAREGEALRDLMESRLAGETLRPSVETGMHDAFPQRLVLHTHPTLVNGLICSRNGKEAAKALFGDRLLWIPSINPGYVLSKKVRDEIRRYRQDFGSYPEIVFMENHGLTTAAETADGIHGLQQEVEKIILSEVGEKVRLSPGEGNRGYAERIKSDLSKSFQSVTGQRPVILFDASPDLLHYAASSESVQPLLRPFSPDHIVYAGHAPLYVSDPNKAGERFHTYAVADGIPPKCVIVKDLGLFSIAAADKTAETARMFFRDALKIAIYAENFGGPKGMGDEEIEFIRGWEVERFRASISLEG